MQSTNNTIFSLRNLVLGLGCSALVACGVENDPAELESSSSAVSSDDDWQSRKVDLLISADASSTMQGNLDAWSSNFEEFAYHLLDHHVDSLRIAVIDGCPSPATFHCEFDAGEEWADISECVTAVKTRNYCDSENDGDERPIESAIQSLYKNSDFVRDDALLVVMAITDEDEEMVVDDQPKERYEDEEIGLIARRLYRRLVGIKGSVDEEFFIGVGGINGWCDGVAENAPILNAVTERFDWKWNADRDVWEFVNHGKTIDLCVYGDDLSAELDDAAERIGAASEKLAYGD